MQFQMSNVPTASGQNHFLAGQDATAMMLNGVDKGGMRGIGLLAMMIAEYDLKQKAIDLANDYYNSNLVDYVYFVVKHAPAMQQSAVEAFGPNNPYYQYDLYASTAGGMAKSAVIDKQWFEARRRVGKYNVGQMRRIDYDMAIARTHGIVAGWNVALRYEFAWTDEHNARTYNRRLSVANVGIGFGNIVRSGLASAVGKLTQAYDNVGDTVASIGNGYQQRAGYQQGRRDVRRLANPSSSNSTPTGRTVENMRTQP